MKDKVTFKIIGAPGTGKAKIMNLLRHQLGKRGFYDFSPYLDLNISEIKSHVESDVNNYKLLERIVVVTDRNDALIPADRKTLNLWIQTPLSYSICTEIFLEVIKPVLEEIKGLVVEVSDPIKNHLSNPAIFPLSQIEWYFEKGYPVQKRN